ncbi:MAG: glycosyltransferase family 2 protein [Vicinamibacterales bacterium]
MSLDVPVLLVIYRRPEATRRVFEAIARAKPQRLLIAADGAATSADREACDATRAVVSRIDWDCEVTHDFSQENLGLNRRMISAIDRIFKEAESAIILEDDCLPHPRFFTFCASMLDRYRQDSRIVHVSGECYRAQRVDHGSYFFSKYPLAWGWATWRRAWSLFDSNMSSWPRVRTGPEAPALFESKDEREYWTSTFDVLHREQSAGRMVSWDYAWYYACMTNGLSIHPAVNLVANIGSGPVASHTHELGALANRPTGPLEEPLQHPAVLIRDRQADLDTFDQRFPGALLKRHRSVGHQIGRPARWAMRLVRELRGGSR